jgi:hypothetical protein
MRCFFLLNIHLFLFSLPLFSQSETHWETVVYDSATWHYFPGTSNPGADWMNPTFNDDSWATGKGGFGYGDDDDLTVLEETSVFIRKKFTIIDKSKITNLLLHVDYDDGFVAFLNGTEIARANMSQAVPLYSDVSQGTHEAVLYQGGAPETFTISDAELALLADGENVICFQIHNSEVTSSDLSIRPFLSVEISGEPITYYDTPPWFAKNVSFESSNLPIFIIDTQGQAIADEPAIIANLGIIDNPSERNQITDSFNGYDGKIEVEFRGESSQMFPKRSLKVKTVTSIGEDSTVSLLGLPADDDWILYAPYTDKTMLRDVISYHLANKMGRYASRARFCELIVNGDYMGVYVLLEKIKQDKNRVDIAKLTIEDTEGDDLTGGYLLRVDKIDGNDYPAWESVPVPRLANENIISFQFFDPDGEKLLDVQKQYIKDLILKFQSALTNQSFKDPVTGYEPYIDIGSFVDFMMINEVNKNIDAYIFSTYMHKDKDSNGGKLKMGPVWDFNLAFGNVDYLANSQFAPGWTYNDGYRMFWFRRLMQDASFADRFACRWLELRQTILSTEYIHGVIDSAASLLAESQERNFQRWPILGTYIWPNQFIGKTYQEEINFLKSWVSDRLSWMENNLPEVCAPPVTAVEETPSSSLAVFPNPSTTGYHFRFKREVLEGRLGIYDRSGRLLFEKVFSGTDYYWNGEFSNGQVLPNGLYIYRMESSDKKQVLTGKIAKH